MTDPVSRKLLDLATQAAGNRPLDTTVPPLSGDRKEFLEAAMSSLTYDVAKKMKEYISTISESDAGTNEEKEDAVVAALEELEYEVQRIDAAADLDTLHGFEPLFSLVGTSTSPDIKANALWVLASAFQHNPRAQQNGTEKGAVELLVNTLASPANGPAVTKKALLATSALTRGHADAMARFVRGAGMEAAATAALRAVYASAPADAPAAPAAAAAPGGADALEPLSPAVMAVVRLFVFYLATVIDPSSDLLGVPPDAISIIGPLSAAVVATAARRGDADVKELAGKVVKAVVLSKHAATKQRVMALLSSSPAQAPSPSPSPSAAAAAAAAAPCGAAAPAAAPATAVESDITTATEEAASTSTAAETTTAPAAPAPAAPAAAPAAPAAASPAAAAPNATAGATEATAVASPETRAEAPVLLLR